MSKGSRAGLANSRAAFAEHCEYPIDGRSDDGACILIAADIPA
jgi:hypothetical protein